MRRRLANALPPRWMVDLLVGSASVLAASTLSTALLAGQDTTHVSSCTGCELRLSQAVSLGSAADPYSPADAAHHVVHDEHGRYIVKAGPPVARILVYSAEGDLDSVLGRPGEGPGEYRSIRQLLMLRGDSVGVVDDSALRLTVLSGDGSVARTQPLPFRPYWMAQLDDGTMIASGLQSTAAAAGYVMHVVATDGSTSPLGPAQSVLPRRPSASRRKLAAARGTFWAARPDRYELTEHASDGTQLRLLKRGADWFPDRETEGPSDLFREPPPPFLVAVHVDEEGLIWTMVRLADTDWAPVDDLLSISREGYFDSIVEVIDPDSGLVVRSQRFPWYGHGFTNDGLIVSERRDDMGVVILDVWRPERLAGRRPEG